MKLIKRGEYWYIRYSEDKRVSLRTTDKRLAKRMFEERKQSLLDSSVACLQRKRGITLEQFSAEYLMQRGFEDLSSKTIKVDEYALNKLQEALGNVPLRLINREVIDDFKAYCKAKSLMKTSVNILLRHLRTSFNYGVEKEYLELNPCVKKSRHDRLFYDLGEQLPRYFGERELEILFNKIDDPRFYVMVNTYFFTGLRRVECLLLKVSDIDLKNDFLTVSKSKTKKERAVPINQYLKPMLSILMRKCKHASCVDMLKQAEKLTEYQSYCLTEFKRLEKLRKAGDIGRLFPWWHHPDTISHKFNALCKSIGVDKRLHDMRHTFGSYLAMAGEDVLKIKELMGHADIKTTEIYAKVNLESLRGSVGQLKAPGR